MANLILPSRWQQQPNYLLDDPASEWANGCRRIITPYSRAISSHAGSLKKVVSGNLAFSNTTNSSGVRVDDKGILSGLNQSTAIALFSTVGSVGSSSGSTIYGERGGNVEIYKFGLSSNTTSAVSFVVRNSSTVLLNNVTTAPLNTQRELHVAAFVTDGASRRTIWCDGNSNVNTSTLANTFNFTNPATVGSDGYDLTTSFKGGIFYVALYDRVVSDSELRELLENPWQIFKPKSRVLYFDVTAPSAAPTLSFPLATSITSTSVVPQVTLTFA